MYRWRTARWSLEFQESSRFRETTIFYSASKMIVITRTFSKSLWTFHIHISEEIIALLSKHHRWLANNLFEIKEYEWMIILKGYLNGKRVRIVIAKTKNGNYVPLEILKKESRNGYNISSDYDVFNFIDRMKWILPMINIRFGNLSKYRL